MKKLSAIVSTFENLSTEGALGATDAALKSAQTATDVAEGNADVIKEAAQIDYMDVAIEDAQNANDQVENLLDAAEQTMQEGGMSDKEAKILEVSHETIMSSIGMSHRSGFSTSPVTSMESYASPRTRMSATIATVESLADSAREIGANIVKALKAALSTVINFIAGLLRNRALMEKHLTNLIKQVEAIDSKDTKKKDRLTAGAGALTVGGTASPATARQILDTAVGLIAASTEIAGVVASTKDSESAVSAVKSSVSGIGKPHNGGYGYLTGGRSIKIDETAGSITITISEGGTGAKDIEAPDKATMLSLTREALSVIKDLRAFEKSQTKLKDGVSAIITRLSEVKDYVKSKVGSAESKAKAGEALEAKKQARLARSVLSKAGGSFPNAAFQAVKAVSDYVTAGVRNYGTKKEEKKD